MSWLEEELWMSTSTWGGTEISANEMYPQKLLMHLLKQMMLHFGAQGACIALHDENNGCMTVRAHIRLKQTSSAPSLTEVTETLPTPKKKLSSLSKKRVTGQLQPHDPLIQPVPLPAADSSSVPALSMEDIEEVTPQQSELFALSASYAIGQDLIGYTWQKNDAYAMRHEDYATLFRANQNLRTDVVPSNYLVVPIRESTLLDELRGGKHSPNVLGIIVLYRVSPVTVSFQAQRVESLQYTEKIALYLQNDALSCTQRRMGEYLEMLQEISTVFPKSVMLAELVEHVYQFALRTVDVNSMLLTLYDRDLERLYDVFALNMGKRIKQLADHPAVSCKTDRPVWWHVTQHLRQTLQFSPMHDTEQTNKYAELLGGTWGDQREAEAFLLIPMKMFNRVIGSLCLVSNRAHAFSQVEIQVLETMLQIVTVSIENAKLYERDRKILYDARQREAQLAAINSALQSINSVLNVTELLNNLVEQAASIAKVDLCVFFEPSSEQSELVAHALYAPSSVQMVDDGSGMPVVVPPKKREPDEIINMIQLPFKDTFLEGKINDGFFYLDQAQLEELSKRSNEGGAILLRETVIENILMLPMSYQTKFLGFLAVPTPRGKKQFLPKEVTTLLAICAQAASAIRNAQLFEQRAEAYAELERLDKLKDEFLVTASHELRTPLTAISGYASQLQRQSARATPKQIHRFATRISVASQQLTDLVSNMTEAAQIGPIDRMKADMRLESVEVFSATEMACNMISQNADHILTLEIPRNLWLLGDPPRVRQVLTNLLENASKYSLTETEITVTARVLPLSEVMLLLSDDQVDHTLILEKGDIPVVMVSVTDEGEGVALEDQQKIFEKFVRAPRSLTTPVRGSGLGLYICRRFIEAMGGQMWLERSVVNEGSTFSFYLPQVKPPVDMIDE